MNPCHPTAGVIAGSATAVAYLTGVLVGYLTRHPAPIAVLAVALYAAHTRTHRPRRTSAPGLAPA